MRVLKALLAVAAVMAIAASSQEVEVDADGSAQAVSDHHHHHQQQQQHPEDLVDNSKVALETINGVRFLSVLACVIPTPSAPCRQPL
jgi:hypothetical protein